MSDSVTVDRPAGSRRVGVLAWLGFGLAAAGALAVALAGPGYRLGLWGLRAAFTVMRWGAYAGAGGALVCLLAAVLPSSRRRLAGRVLALVGLAAGAAAIGVPWSMLQRARTLPPIHDIATDTDHPPAFQALLPARRDAPNGWRYGGPEVAAQQHEGYPDIQPIALPATAPDRAFAAALEVARRRGWRIAAADRAHGRIEATDITPWFGFADDVVVRVRPRGRGSVVDLRSESRLGGSDVGENAARIRAFRRDLEARIESRPGR